LYRNPTYEGDKEESAKLVAPDLLNPTYEGDKEESAKLVAPDPLNPT